MHYRSQFTQHRKLPWIVVERDSPQTEVALMYIKNFYFGHDSATHACLHCTRPALLHARRPNTAPEFFMLKQSVVTTRYHGSAARPELNS